MSRRIVAGRAIAALAAIIRQLPPNNSDVVIARVLGACADKLEAAGAERLEYLLLALFILQAAAR